MNQRDKGWNNWWVLAGVLGLAIAPLFLLRDAEFSGSDGAAEAAIQEVEPGYEPWLNPLIEPASSEIESLLFAIQAGTGTGMIGYVIGRYQGRQEQRKRVKD